jgi:hypothetical protein
VRNFYFNGQNITDEMNEEFAFFQTDAGYKFPIDRMTKIFAHNSNESIFYYEFDYVGALNFIKTFFFLRGYKGVAHAGN